MQTQRMTSFGRQRSPVVRRVTRSGDRRLPLPLADRIVVRIGRRLGGAERLGHVLQVDADAVPGARSARASRRRGSAQARGIRGPPDASPSSARGLIPSGFVFDFAIVMTGSFGLGEASRLSRAKAPRAGASPALLRKCGGHGASASPALLLVGELEELLDGTSRRRSARARRRLSARSRARCAA